MPDKILNADRIPYLLNTIKFNNSDFEEVADGLLELYYYLASQDKVDMSYVSKYPPGHFYSPLPSTKEVENAAHRIWKATESEKIPGIDLRVREQQRLFARFLKYYQEMPFKDKRQDGLTYYFDNRYFCHADAIVLYSMMREFSPKRIIEVGSGFSSCVMIDTNQLFLDNKTELTFIEPHPQRFIVNVGKKICQIKLIKRIVQDVDLSFFEMLEENDILFLDSSHVGKIGSDVLHLLFEVLPNLASGVIIHFHDIFFPFEYPRNWVENRKRAWNENYFIRSFLQYNNTFKIIYFNNYIGKFHKSMLQKYMPIALMNIGGSLYLRKEG